MGSPLGGLPGPPLLIANQLAGPWKAWFSNAQAILQDASNSGTTAQRPTTFLYVGKPYFDTTLGIPIWLRTPATPVWVNATGTPV